MLNSTKSYHLLQFVYVGGITNAIIEHGGKHASPRRKLERMNQALTIKEYFHPRVVEILIDDIGHTEAGSLKDLPRLIINDYAIKNRAEFVNAVSELIEEQEAKYHVPDKD